MAVEVATPPRRNLAWVLEQSTPYSLFVMGIGIAALALVVLGSLVVLLLNGVTPVDSLVTGFKSNDFTGVNLFGVIAGVVAMVLGWGTYRRMATKVSREQAIAGAVLGAQATFLGALLLYFSEGDITTFVTNFMAYDLLEGTLPAFARGAKNTLILALSSEFFGIMLGLILAVFAISKRAVVRAPARIYINFFRGTPLAWQLIFIGVALPIALQQAIPTYTAAVIAFSLNAGAYSAEVFRAGIQSVERSQLEAARGLGLSYMQAMRYSILPQAVRRVIPPLMNEFVILIKDTSLVILLGLTVSQFDLMSVGNNKLENTFNATYLIGTALGYLAISLPSIRIVNMLEKRLRSGLVGVGA
jgi:His/Glu/Gln/Arg/opine family amino acid ABC transporter permease subunit